MEFGTGSVWPTPEARIRLLDIYDRRLALWPVDFEEHDVVTGLGRTHVISAGRAAAPPLVMLHPAGVPGFVWRPVIAPLAERFRVYCLDTIGDVGRSELTDPLRHPRSGPEYATWLGEVCDGLRIDAANFVAASMGGWIALHFAADAPARVRRLALLGPMGLSSWPATLYVLVRLFSITLWPSPRKKERLIAWAVGESTRVKDDVVEWMAAVIDTGCKPRLGNPLPVPAQRLRAITARTLVVLGGRDRPVGNPHAVAQRALAHLRGAEIELLPDSGHAMSVDAPDAVVRRLLAFFAGAQQ